MSTARVVYVDQSSDFWPTGWMVWACAALGACDIGLIGFVVAQLVGRGV